MIGTPVCKLLDIEHPIALGGMGSAPSPAMIAAVSRAGGLGAMGCHYLTPEQIRERTAATRKETNKPFGLNFLLFDTREDSFAAALELRPAVMQFAWARQDQDLRPYFDRAHEAGCKVTYMAGAVKEAVRAAKAGADVIVAQGSEGGGHVGWMASMPLIPMVVDAVARFRCSPPAGLPTAAAWSRRSLWRTRHSARHALPGHGRVAAAPQFQAGDRRQRRPRHSAFGNSRYRRRPGVAGRHDALATQPLHRTMGRPGVGLAAKPGRGARRLRAARESGDVDEGPLSMGQDAGLIHDIPSAADIVARIAREADEILTQRLSRLTVTSN